MMTVLVDRIAAWTRRLLRIGPPPSAAPRLTPFARHAREVRTEALRAERERHRAHLHERRRRENFIRKQIVRGRANGGPAR